MPELPTYLTEAILTIQHELQTALDYIETVATQEPSEAGAAPSLVTVDTMRIRVPFILQPEQEARPMPEGETPPITGVRLSKTQLDVLKSRLLSREGLLVRREPDQAIGTFTKMRVISPSVPAAGEAAPTPELVGQIELTFTRVPRSMEQQSVQEGAPPAEPAPTGDPVPGLTGLTLAEATRFLTAGNWRFAPHSASKEEVDAAPKEDRGRVLRQQPAAGILVDKQSTTIQFWVALSNLPVDTLDGIGEKLATRLSERGISTVGQLSLASAAQVGVYLRMSEARALTFVDMAALISGLTIAGFPDEVVEVLVKGVGISSLYQLADTDADQVYAACQEAIRQGRVRVPRGFTISREDVGKWVEMARNALSAS